MGLHLGLHLLLLHALEINMLLGLHLGLHLLLLLHARMPWKASCCLGYIWGCICLLLHALEEKMKPKPEISPKVRVILFKCM